MDRSIGTFITTLTAGQSFQIVNKSGNTLILNDGTTINGGFTAYFIAVRIS